MAILQATEMRYGYPTVLIHLVRVAGRYSCFSGESKLSNAIGVHLLGVRAVERIWRDFLLRFRSRLILLFDFSLRLFDLYNRVLTRPWVRLSLFTHLIPHLSILCRRG